MFVDNVKVLIQAGNGGNGLVSFRHEKFIDKGGPDGGDGGDGGDLIFKATSNVNTLAAFRYQKQLKAQSGEPGRKKKQHGKSGENLVVLLPVGTEAINESGEKIAELISDGQEVLVAKGGKGGFGNAHFSSSRRQTPRVAEKGEPGEKLELNLELKLIADVGLVGLPNAGKSTLLSTVSNARPEIADYPFTTLKPNLGVVDINNKSSLLIADIPGLIEGASQGKGLGDEFLRHIERTNVLVHLIDFYNEDVAHAYKTIQEELKLYKVDLTKRPQVIVINKIDGADPKIVKAKMAQLRKVAPTKSKILAISAVSGEGVKDLIYELESDVQKQQRARQRKAKKEAIPVLRYSGDGSEWQISKTGETFVVTGAKIERFALRTDFGNIHGINRLRDIMEKMGIMKELERQGIEPGQKICIGKSQTYEIEY